MWQYGINESGESVLKTRKSMACGGGENEESSKGENGSGVSA
jgi:hypothetical protein